MDVRGFSLLLIAGVGLWLLNAIFDLGVGVGGFFLALALAIAFRTGLAKVFPVLLPRRKLRLWALGWAGGFFGSVIEGFLGGLGLEVAGLHVVGALLGSLVFLLAWGLWPFVRILVGRERTTR